MLPLKVAFAASDNVATASCPTVTLTVPGVAVSVNAGARAVTVTLAAAEVLGLNFLSPLYTAVMLCGPAARRLVEYVAVEPLTEIDPSSAVPS